MAKGSFGELLMSHSHGIKGFFEGAHHVYLANFG
jgi:hypothetical protein